MIAHDKTRLQEDRRTVWNGVPFKNRACPKTKLMIQYCKWISFVTVWNYHRNLTAFLNRCSLSLSLSLSVSLSLSLSLSQIESWNMINFTWCYNMIKVYLELELEYISILQVLNLTEQKVMTKVVSFFMKSISIGNCFQIFVIKSKDFILIFWLLIQLFLYLCEKKKENTCIYIF